MENTTDRYTFDKEKREQLVSQFSDFPVGIKFVVKGLHEQEETKEMVEFIRAYTKLSPAFSLKIENIPTEQNAPLVELWVNGNPSGVSFCGVPSGRKLDSFTAAILNAGGKGDNMPDGLLRGRIERLDDQAFLFTFVSKNCPGCPDVIEAVNLVALLNHRFKIMVVDIDSAPEFSAQYGVQSVPAVFANGELLSAGHASLGQLVTDMEKKFGSSETPGLDDHSALGFDVIVAGGGPAGVSAAVYLARKGLRTAVVADKIGGQVSDTTYIDNLISMRQTTGSDLAANLLSDLKDYDITLFNNRKIVATDILGQVKRVKTDIGEWFEAPALIVATGASWRRLNIPGETKYLGKGVAYCSHCDGPFYKGRKVAVVGGGNSGVETAIDLAGICTQVDLFEVSDTLKADDVLINRLKSFDNVKIHLSSKITEILGNPSSGVTSIIVKDTEFGEEKDYRVDGVFVQIGLDPNSEVFVGQLQINEKGEIITDKLGRTSVTGVYAAGDVTDFPYKQIVIAIGDGAKAALSAVTDRIRGII